ncbi:MAG: LicD family protein [Prevotella sp.]|nr:LicD family protein [Prevotella sp.]
MSDVKQISEEEQKRIQLDILSDVAGFCERNNLRYFLAYGTLIGAVRHQGYIPWDDDVDIIMPRPDYDIFIDTYNHTSGNYQVYCSKYNKKCFINFAKVHDVRTRYQEGYAVETEYGIFVDIFPFDGYHSRFQYSQCYYASLLLRSKTSVWFTEKAFYKNLISLFLKMMLLPISIRRILGFIEKKSRRIEYESSTLVCFFTDIAEPIRKSIFDNYIYSLFEGKMYRIPKEYDQILRIQYGDYMELPPIEERICKHYAKVWWK